MDEVNTKRQNVRGVHARFLFENPRFINAPICNINYSTDGNATALECLKWSDHSHDETANQSSTERKIRFASDSESRLLMYKHPGYQKAPKTTLDKVLAEDTPVKTKEYISYKHKYNCRTDPNEPIRGKLHGSFVWDIS